MFGRADGAWLLVAAPDHAGVCVGLTDGENASLAGMGGSGGDPEAWVVAGGCVVFTAAGSCGAGMGAEVCGGSGDGKLGLQLFWNDGAFPECARPPEGGGGCCGW